MDKIMYYLYHIPGKKIGVTRDLNNRVTKQQGYFPDEYEVLDHSTDIDYISKREIELQQSYGYKIDRVEYKNLGKKMKINATEMTSTFPYPLNKLKGNLMDNMGKTWETVFGKFELDKETVNWIVDNAQTSMYDAKRSYIYNKAFFEKFVNKNLKQAKVNAKEATDKALEHIEAMKAELISHSQAVNTRDMYQDLEIKETDRLLAMKIELNKIGVNFFDDNGIWTLERRNKPFPNKVSIDTYEDHRMAMAFAPLATELDLTINNPGVVNKSYPSYWDDMK